jgi:methionyl-tRNA formyltransferase
MRILIAGGGRLAVSVMEPLLDAGHVLIGLLQNGRQTRPGRRALFRASRLLMPPSLDAAALALRRRIPIFWIDRMDDAELRPLRALEPDLLLTAGFSRIFNDAMLAVPGLGCFNVHSSLLPRHRGASPFAQVILQGEPETGVTFHVMERGVDAGPILSQERLALTALDTSVTVYYRCCDLAREMAADTIADIELHGLTGQPQDESQATYDPKFTERDAAVDWREPADHIERLVRAAVAYYPAWFMHRGRRVEVSRATFDPRDVEAAPGTVLETRPYPVVATGRGRLIIHAAHTPRPIPWTWPAAWAPLRREECLVA